MTKRSRCLRHGCQNPVPRPRTKYCSNQCMVRYLNVDCKLVPKREKTCQYEGCRKLFTGPTQQKYCSSLCRIKHQYHIVSDAIHAISMLPHPCVCCVPPKMLVGMEQYCPDMGWMKKLPADLKRQAKASPELVEAQRKREEEINKKWEWKVDANKHGDWYDKKTGARRPA